MRQGPNSGQYQKFQIKQPPNFNNYYKKLEEQKNKKKYQDAPTIRQRYSEENAIGLERYQRRNQPVPQKTHSMTLRSANTIKSSPVNMGTQYQMYKTDTTNTFYQDRQQATILNRLQTIQPLVRSSLFYLLAIWLVLFFVKPYGRICPSNAQCGVYIHCHNGYVLLDEQCVISEQSKNNAHYICTSAIQNLKEQYGSKQCESPYNSDYKPSITFGEIIQENQNYYQINSAIRNEIYQWLSNHDHKKLYKYSFDGNVIYPNQKKYTIFCKFHKMIRQPWYYPVYVLVLVGLFFVLAYVRIYKQKRRVYRIYEYLKAKVQQKKDIIIDLEQLENKFGKIYRALWDNIQQLRRQDKKICFYEDENLHWKLI